MVALTSSAVLHLGLSPKLRVWFGPAWRLPCVRLEVPGAILLTAGALFLTSVAGLCDRYWRSRFGLAERWAWLVAGFVFRLLTVAVWGAPPIWTFTAAVLLPAGAAAGRWLYHSLQSPSRVSISLLLVAGLAIPFALGFLDLYLRHHTP